MEYNKLAKENLPCRQTEVEKGYPALSLDRSGVFLGITERLVYCYDFSTNWPAVLILLCSFLYFNINKSVRVLTVD